jgi:hypothetical protein
MDCAIMKISAACFANILEVAMNTNIKPIARWKLLVGHLALVTFTLACMVFTGTQSNPGSVTLHLDKDVVKVQGGSDDQSSVGGDPTFTLVGKVESTNPWKVGGVTLETRESTITDTGLKTGDLVKVTGVVLAGKTWVAYSIKLVTKQTTPTVLLIGKVTAMDPWVVDGFSLHVTPETVIEDGIKVGSIVRVEITLLADGTWKVVSISLLSSAVTTSGCVNVIAAIASVNGDEVQFLGWPVTVILDTHIKIENDVDQEKNHSQGDNQGDDEGDDEGDHEGESNTNTQATSIAGTLTSNEVVLAVLCTSDNGQIVVVQIVILNVEQEANPPAVDGGGKVLVCHKPNQKGGHTLSLPQSAVPAHLGHGDTLGACP